jgi:hypothetical protein
MLGSIILISYGLISVIGSVAILFKGSAKTASGWIYFFLLGHVTLVVITMYDLFTPLHFLWFIFGLSLVVSSVLSLGGSMENLYFVIITGFITL